MMMIYSQNIMHLYPLALTKCATINGLFDFVASQGAALSAILAPLFWDCKDTARPRMHVWAPTPPS